LERAVVTASIELLDGCDELLRVHRGHELLHAELLDMRHNNLLPNDLALHHDALAWLTDADLLDNDTMPGEHRNSGKSQQGEGKESFHGWFLG
jgi:hypothetical protein